MPLGNKILAYNPLNNPLTSPIPRIPNPHACQLDPWRHGESFQGFKAALPLRAQDDILGGWRGEGGKVEGAANKKMEGIHDDEYGAEERETLTRKRGSKKTQFTKIDHELRSRMDNTSPGFSHSVKL